MIRNLITIPNKILRMKSKRIGYVDDSIRQLANDMIETTVNWDHDSELGAALAAIQVGEPIKLTVVRNDFENAEDETFTTLINPEIVKVSDTQIDDVEGCLSVPQVYGRVSRALKVKVKALDEHGKPVRLSLEGFPARVIQHEIDHMNGIIFLDHVQSTADIFHLDDDGKLRPLAVDEAKKLKT